MPPLPLLALDEFRSNRANDISLAPIITSYKMWPVRSNHIWAVSHSAALLELLNKVINILKYWCILYIKTISRGVVLGQSLWAQRRARDVTWQRAGLVYLPSRATEPLTLLTHRASYVSFPSACSASDKDLFIRVKLIYVLLLTRAVFI